DESPLRGQRHSELIQSLPHLLQSFFTTGVYPRITSSSCRPLSELVLSKNATEERDHLCPGLIHSFGIVTRAFVAHKSVFRRIELHIKANSRLLQSADDFGASLFGNVRIERTKDDQHLARNLIEAFKRPCIRILPKLSV